MRVAGGVNFFDGVAHFPGSHELALLDVDGFAGLAGSQKQVGLAAEEGGDLENIDGVSGLRRLIGFMDVGGDRDGKLFADGGEDLEALVNIPPSPEATMGAGGRAIGLVEGGLEDIRNDGASAELAAGLLDRAGDREAEVEGFNHARARNKKELGPGVESELGFGGTDRDGENEFLIL